MHTIRKKSHTCTYCKYFRQRQLNGGGGLKTANKTANGTCSLLLFFLFFLLVSPCNHACNCYCYSLLLSLSHCCITFARNCYRLIMNYQLILFFFFYLNFVFVIRRLGQPRRAARKFQLIRQRSRSQRGKANAQKLSLQKARTHDATSQSAAMLGINSVRTVNSANREPVAVIGALLLLLPLPLPT